MKYYDAKGTERNYFDYEYRRSHFSCESEEDRWDAKAKKAENAIVTLQTRSSLFIFIFIAFVGLVVTLVGSARTAMECSEQDNSAPCKKVFIGRYIKKDNFQWWNASISVFFLMMLAGIYFLYNQNKKIKKLFLAEAEVFGNAQVTFRNLSGDIATLLFSSRETIGRLYDRLNENKVLFKDEDISNGGVVLGDRGVFFQFKRDAKVYLELLNGDQITVLAEQPPRANEATPLLHPV